MNGKGRSRTTDIVDEGPHGETRHRDDTGGPLANNSSELPDRSNAIAEGSPGQIDPVHGSGYQKTADSAHPDFPDQGGLPDEDVRRRAYELWEAEGQPEGSHDRHWLQAERELRGNRA